MTRVKRSNVARKRRKKILHAAKGFRGRLKNIFRQAKPAVLHAFNYAFRDRRRKKRDFRRLWIARIQAAVQAEGLRYSVFMNMLKKKDVRLNRKALSEIASNHPEDFSALVKAVR